MKTLLKRVLVILAGCLVGTSAMAQPAPTSRFLYSVKLTFQSYGLPFKNLGESFKNGGGAIGVDYAYNKSQTLFQSFSLGYQGHTQHEESIYLNTQFCYRPVLFKNLEPAVALGVGRMLSFSNPKNPYYEVEEGGWQKSQRQYQGHWQAPLSVSLGYRAKTTGNTIITPFVGYEAVPVINYNKAFVALPYSLINVGTRIKFQNQTKS